MNDFDDSDEIIAEDWPTYWTQVPVWILLAGSSGQAYKLYGFLAEHINTRQPGKRIACPKQTAIARVLGLKNSHQVKRYSDELEALGAMRISEYRYANGMRRGYRYHLRFNPPEGYTGLLSLAQFYEANTDLKSATAQGRVSAAKNAAKSKPAGQPGGTKNSTAGGTKNSTARGAKNSTAKRDQGNVDQEERDDAPSARSAPDARRASTGSTPRETRGSAASGKSRHRLTKAEYDAIKTVRGLLPDDLEAKLPKKTPPNLGTAILEGLAVGSPFERTPAQLVEYRVMRRWNGYWASKFYDGELGSLVGPVIAMLKHQPECGDISCEDRVNIHSGELCRLCEVRGEDRKAGQGAGQQAQEPSGAADSVPEQRWPGQRVRPKCPGCHLPLATALEPELCRECREETAHA